jgi:molybdenum cofactor guanylyltransferase
MPEFSQLDAAGFVLAGGQSSRMGHDKALLQFAGRPLVTRALSIVQSAGLSASIAGAQPAALSSLRAFAPLIQDSEPNRGPLSGICAALASASKHHAVFLPVDLPFMPASLLLFLLHHARVTGHAVTLPSVNGFVQTFPAVLDRALLPGLQAALHSSDQGCFSAFHTAAASLGQPVSRVAVEFLVQSGQVLHPDGLPAARWFLNLNNPSDLKRAETLASPCVA